MHAEHADNSEMNELSGRLFCCAFTALSTFRKECYKGIFVSDYFVDLLLNFGKPRRFICGLWCVPEGRVHLVGESPTRVMVGWPGSWQAVRLGNWPCRSPATKAALGGRANRRAVTSVKPEQASKGKLWTPTQPKRGEGSTVRGSSRQMHLYWSTGVVGTARRDRGTGKRGRSTCDEGSDLNGAVRRRSVWKSDRVVVPLKPGNAGGGKDPDFWCVFEADEVR